MILIDLTQVMISNLMMHVNSDPSSKIDEGIVRHVIMNSIRSYKKQFKEKYGEVVICCDSKKYWRRDVFPFYKANRKKAREASNFDWNLIFDILGKLKDDLKTSFPYRVVEVLGAEADDVVAVLATKFSQTEEVLIISSDKDFVQLQKNPNVFQYSPMMKRYIKTDNPLQFIKEHIIRGDRGDGIPNFLSSDNVFVVGERQKSINTKKLTEWINSNPEDFCVTDVMKHGFERNQKLVDFDYIPDNIRDAILQSYEENKPKTKTAMLEYMIKHGLKHLIEVADEF